MKHFLPLFLLPVFMCNAFAQSGRPAMSNKIMAAPRYTASVNQLNGMSAATASTTENQGTTNQVNVKPDVDMREAERNACINNNIGIGNTFVWASRFSDPTNYAGMVEDVVNPANNVCFVRVELKSDDESRISVSDLGAKYFMWGESIECGIWANKDVLEKRILDAKKGNRIGGIVAASIGGAGIGVGAMELFGNRLIGGKVEGQKNKNLTEEEVYRSQLLTLKNKDFNKYEEYCASLKVIKKACDENDNTIQGFDCVKYSALLDEFGK